MAVEEQLARLRASSAENNGCASWNQWRKDNRNIVIDLGDADLSDIDLSSIDLSDAGLRDADFSGAHLRGAHFTGAHLNGAWFYRARLIEADFRGAILEFTVFTDADLTGADLSSARLTNAECSRTRLTGAHLRDADLSGAWFYDADLMGADLSNARLTGSDLTVARLTGARLTDARLVVAHLTGADLTDADLTNADLTGARLNHADLSDTCLVGVDLTCANLRYTRLTGADLSGAQLTRTRVSRKQLVSARGADLTAMIQPPVNLWRSLVLTPWSNDIASALHVPRAIIWSLGWIWAIVGLLTGSMFTAYLVMLLASPLPTYHAIIVTVGAVSGGLFIQIVGFTVLLLLAWTQRGNNARSLLLLTGGAVLSLMFAGVAIYRLLTRLGPESGLIGQGFVYGLVVKLVLLFVLPLVKNIRWGIPMALGLRAVGLGQKRNRKNSAE